MARTRVVLGDGMKRNPERENFAIRPTATRPARLIHIRVTFNPVTRYMNYGHQKFREVQQDQTTDLVVVVQMRQVASSLPCQNRNNTAET